jgi:signal transduction histidine kinase
VIVVEPPWIENFDINEAIREVNVVTRGEATKYGISVETQLGEGLPLIPGDRVQLQQVIRNPVVNGIEAMSGLDVGPRQCSSRPQISARTSSRLLCKSPVQGSTGKLEE